jgi:hypothetical protein
MTTRNPLIETTVATIPATRLRWFAILTWLTTLAIFLQAVTAGQFVSQGHKQAWVDIHGGVADAAWGIALITAIFALVTLRRSYPRITWLTVALFVLTLAQTGIGHLITDFGMNGWAAVHVPLAFIIFGLTGWLSLTAASLRRQSAPRAA